MARPHITGSGTLTAVDLVQRLRVSPAGAANAMSSKTRSGSGPSSQPRRRTTPWRSRRSAEPKSSGSVHASSTPPTSSSL
jgi:hypothetical protein